MGSHSLSVENIKVVLAVDEYITLHQSGWLGDVAVVMAKLSLFSGCTRIAYRSAREMLVEGETTDKYIYYAVAFLFYIATSTQTDSASHSI